MIDELAALPCAPVQMMHQELLIFMLCISGGASPSRVIGCGARHARRSGPWAEGGPGQLSIRLPSILAAIFAADDLLQALTEQLPTLDCTTAALCCESSNYGAAAIILRS